MTWCVLNGEVVENPVIVRKCQKRGIFTILDDFEGHLFHSARAMSTRSIVLTLCIGDPDEMQLVNCLLAAPRLGGTNGDAIDYREE